MDVGQQSQEGGSESASPKSKTPRGMTGITVLVADSQLLFSDALAGCLAKWEEFTVLDERPITGIEALQAAVDRRPDVALIDYWLTEMDGPAVTRHLLARPLGTKVFHLSWGHERTHVEISLASGAVGFLPKSLRVAKVAEAIRRAVSGESPVFENQLARMVDAIRKQSDSAEEQARRFRTLTPRQLEVLRELARGRTVGQIAQHLGITYGTARTHVTRILAKTGAASQLEVVAMARAQALVP